MSNWLWLLGLGGLLLGFVWLVTRRMGGSDDLVLPTPVEKFGPLSPAEADAMRARADDRRERAEEKHTQGHAIESGHVERNIKLASGRGMRS